MDKYVQILNCLQLGSAKQETEVQREKERYVCRGEERDTLMPTEEEVERWRRGEVMGRDGRER